MWDSKKSYNFPRNSNFERLLLDLFNIKSDCSYQNYAVYYFFYQAFNMQNIPSFEQVFNIGQDKTIADQL